MRSDARDHAVDFEDGGDLDVELRLMQADAELPAFALSLLDDGDLDVVSPGYKKRAVVLPVERALEEIGARRILGAADVGDPLARRGVVYPHALEK